MSKKSLTAFQLKLIAIIAMVIAHTGFLFLPSDASVLRDINQFINNITAPIIFQKLYSINNTPVL